MKASHVIVLGLGTFGAAVARRLAHNKVRVTGVDQDEERVAELQDVLFEALVADVTDPRTIEQLPIDKVDAVVVSLGEDFARSILACLHVLEHKPRRVIAKVVTTDHAKILSKLGVSDLVFPEVEIAEQWADRITWPNVLLRLMTETQQEICELSVPDSLVGKTLREADLRRKYGLLVIGIKNTRADTQYRFSPDPDTVLSDEDVLLVVGDPEGLARFREL